MALVCDINYLPVATMRDRQKIFTKLRVTATPRPNQQRYGAKERHVDFYLQKDGIIHLPYAIGRALRPKQPLPDTPKIIASLKPDIDPWWPEQVEDMNLAMDFLRKKGSVLMHRPTASGKTRLACALICNLGRRAIVISKRQWQGQWIKTLNKITNLDVERVMSGRRFRRRAEVYVVSIGLLSRLKDMYDQFGTVIIDEVDAHCTATLRNILELQPRYVVGLTATPKRPDGMDGMISLLLGPFCVHRPSTSKLTVIRAHTGVQTEISASEWSAFVVAIGTHPDRVALLTRLLSAIPQFRVLILCWQEVEVLTLAAAFTAAGISCSTYYRDMSTYENAQVVISTIAKGGRGFDESTTCHNYQGVPFSLLTLWSATREWRNLLDQLIGRLRITYRVVLDLVDEPRVCKEHAKDRSKHYEEVHASFFEYDHDEEEDLTACLRKILYESALQNGLTVEAPEESDE